MALLDGKSVGLVFEVSREDVLEEADEVGGRLEDEREQREPDEHLHDKRKKQQCQPWRGVEETRKKQGGEKGRLPVEWRSRSWSRDRPS